MLLAVLLLVSGETLLAQTPAPTTSEHSWVSGPNVMCGGYGGFAVYRTTVALRHVRVPEGGHRIVDAVTRVSSQTFAEHLQNDVSVVIEVVQGDRVRSRAALTEEKPDVAARKAADDARPKVLAAGTTVTMPKGSALRVTVRPDVMIDGPSCLQVPANCNWCSLGTSTHTIVLR